MLASHVVCPQGIASKQLEGELPKARGKRLEEDRGMPAAGESGSEGVRGGKNELVWMLVFVNIVVGSELC